MTDIDKARQALTQRIVDGEGTTSPSQRRAAYDNAGLPDALAGIIDKVAKQSHRVTDDDVAAARASGLSEDAIFELCVCAAVGQASRQYDAALAALEQADAPGDPR